MLVLAQGCDVLPQAFAQSSPRCHGHVVTFCWGNKANVADGVGILFWFYPEICQQHGDAQG